MAQSESSDLNKISTDATNKTVSNMSKKKDVNRKDNIVPTYPDGSINYDGTYNIILFCFNISINIVFYFLAIYEDQDESDGKIKSILMIIG